MIEYLSFCTNENDIFNFLNYSILRHFILNSFIQFILKYLMDTQRKTFRTEYYGVQSVCRTTKLFKIKRKMFQLKIEFPCNFWENILFLWKIIKFSN